MLFKYLMLLRYRKKILFNINIRYFLKYNMLNKNNYKNKKRGISMPDIVSIILIHKILKVYRQQVVPTTGIVSKGDRRYVLHAENKACRIFNKEEDGFSKNITNDEYNQSKFDFICKFNIDEGDVIYVQDEMRIYPYVVKEVEYLGLEPFTKFFKHYSCVVYPFTGKVQLVDDTYAQIPLIKNSIDLTN